MHRRSCPQLKRDHTQALSAVSGGCAHAELWGSTAQVRLAEIKACRGWSSSCQQENGGAMLVVLRRDGREVASSGGGGSSFSVSFVSIANERKYVLLNRRAERRLGAALSSTETTARRSIWSARSLLPFTLPPGEVRRLENRHLEKDSPPPREEKFARDPQAQSERVLGWVWLWVEVWLCGVMDFVRVCGSGGLGFVVLGWVWVWLSMGRRKKGTGTSGGSGHGGAGSGDGRVSMGDGGLLDIGVQPAGTRTVPTDVDLVTIFGPLDGSTPDLGVCGVAFPLALDESRDIADDVDVSLCTSFVNVLRRGDDRGGIGGGSGGCDGGCSRGPGGQGSCRVSMGERSSRGHVIVLESVVEVGVRTFATTLVGLILGHCPPFAVVERLAMRLWAIYGIRRVRAFGPGQLLLEFDSTDRFPTLLERSPWTIAGRPVMLRHWTPDMSFEDLQPRTLPVWVKFSGMPTSLYTEVCECGCGVCGRGIVFRGEGDGGGVHGCWAMCGVGETIAPPPPSLPWPEKKIDVSSDVMSWNCLSSVIHGDPIEVGKSWIVLFHFVSTPIFAIFLFDFTLSQHSNEVVITTMAKEQAERRATTKLMFDLGQKAYEKGIYGRSVEYFEAALTIIPRLSLFGGE
ncbi:hypothetical protein Drorol1_Dr00012072 [Drosera rotundifolia]